ncbi:MAG TPA: radical SAM protein [Candidatus Acidoferrales bacterium]|nr:radical SAM protein [Candidatus Acidoferrales bacterium]
MIKRASTFSVIRALASNVNQIRVKPSINWFFIKYLRKFNIINVGGKLIIHSHLPPINSRAYKRFIAEHLLNKNAGPSHAQIGVTNACPQDCEYCYSKNKKGKVMETGTIIRLINDLKEMGVFWIGFTGGEPLLNKDIVRIVESASDRCAVKLFTTGSTLTERLARDLKNAGLSSVSVSLDHWKESEHDKVRRYPGAFKIALNALEVFKSIGDIHVGISAVLSKEMVRRRQVEEFLGFLEKLEIHEAWLSESKPAIPQMWNDNFVINEEERLELCKLQNEYNKRGRMTVNYLGHFECKEHFGCAAANKMIYIDACGNVSPCVFMPVSFGNVNQESVRDIYSDMKRRFPTENRCFVNANYPLLRKNYHDRLPLSEEETLAMMEEARFAPMAKFFQLHYT